MQLLTGLVGCSPTLERTQPPLLRHRRLRRCPRLRWTMPRRRRSRGRFLFKTTTRCLHPRLVHRPGRVCSLHLRGGVSQDSFFSLKSGPHDILIERQFHQTTNIPFTRVFLSLSPPFGVGMGPAFSAVFYSLPPRVLITCLHKKSFFFFSVSLDMARAHGSGLCRSAGGMKWEMERMGWRVWSGGGERGGGNNNVNNNQQQQPAYLY